MTMCMIYTIMLIRERDYVTDIFTISLSNHIEKVHVKDFPSNIQDSTCISFSFLRHFKDCATDLAFSWSPIQHASDQ